MPAQKRETTVKKIGDTEVVVVSDLPIMGRVLWPAAEALCWWLETAEKGQAVRRGWRRCVEVGAGVGLPGMYLAAEAAARGVSGEVCITDASQEAVERIREGLKANRLHSACQGEVLDWAAESLPAVGGGYDLLVASDVVFDVSDFIPFSESAQTLLLPSGTAVLCTTSWFEPLLHTLAAAMERCSFSLIHKEKFAPPVGDPGSLSGSVFVTVFLKDPE